MVSKIRRKEKSTRTVKILMSSKKLKRENVEKKINIFNDTENNINTATLCFATNDYIFLAQFKKIN